MPAIVLLGAQWGDEGKGKATDLLGSSVDYVVKYNGGNNAGHTIVVGDDRPFVAALVTIDENLSLWRYRHALMVQRMIGAKIGTGGSSGQDYLRRTVEAHRVFLDFFNLSTYLIPRSMLPALPSELREQLGFRWHA